MRQIILSTLSFLFLITISSCRDSDNLNIQVVDDDDLYKYSATFQRNKSRLVERFINNSIAPSSFKSDGDLDITTTLNDQTKFHYESSPGEVIIELDKRENSPASYHRVKKMCEGLNQILNPKK